MKLEKEHKCFNPYTIGKNKAASIRLFNNGQIVCEIMRGWIGDNNNDGCDVIEKMEFDRKRKIDLYHKRPFFISSNGEADLYIPTDLLPNFVDLGETLRYSTDFQNVYGQSISFEFEKTQGLAEKFEHLRGVKSHILRVGFTRSERTEKGRKVDAIKSIFNAAGVDITNVDAELIYKSRETILEAMA